MRQMKGYVPDCRMSHDLVVKNLVVKWLPLIALGVLAVIAALTFVPSAQGAPGDLDPSFGNGGVVATDIGNIDSISDMALQNDGRIVVVGNSWTGDNSDSEDFTSHIVTARYNPDGTLDTNFSEDGIVETSIGSYSWAEGVAIQEDGKIVVAGNTLDGEDFVVARYNTDGSLDTSFSGDGIQTTSFGVGGDIAHDVALQVDGKIVVVGSNFDSLADIALARYNTDGSLDTSFSGDGKVVTDIFESDYGAAVAIQEDGKIIVAGGSNGPVVIRYLADGSVDPSFTFDAIDWGPGYHTAQDVVIQSDGKIVIAGGEGDFIFARYNSDGSVDPSFAGTGAQSVDFGGMLDSAYAVGIQENGYVVAAGSANAEGSLSDLATTRLDANGALDTTFGADGRVMLGTNEDGDHASSLGIQDDGKIVVAGDINSGDFALARYEHDGPPAVQRTLTVNTAGKGSLVSSPAGIDCGAICAATFNEGETVRLTATPDHGWSLLGWSWPGSSSGCDFDESASHTCDVTLTADAEVTAEFKDSGEESEHPAQPPDDGSDDPASDTESTPSSGDDSQPSPPAPPSPGIAHFVKLGRVVGNIALIRTYCAGDTRCRSIGKLIARVRTRQVIKRNGRRRVVRRPRNVLIGRGRFNVAPRKAAVLRLRLTPPGKKLLRRSSRRGLRAILVGRGIKNRAINLRPHAQTGKRRSRRARAQASVLATRAPAATLRRLCVKSGLRMPKVTKARMSRPGVDGGLPQHVSIDARYKALNDACKGKYRRFGQVLVQIRSKSGKKWISMTTPTGQVFWNTLYTKDEGGVGGMLYGPSGHEKGNWYFNKTCRPVRALFRNKVVRNIKKRVWIKRKGERGFWSTYYPTVSQRTMRVWVKLGGRCAR